MPAIPIRLVAIATLLAAGAALAGLAVSGLYVDAPNWVQQARGTDLATLFLAVPVLAVGLRAASRASSPGRLAVMAGLLYLVYNYAIFAFAVAMNPLTVVHIAIFGLSLWTLLLTGREGVRAAEGVTVRLNRRAAGGLLIGVAAMFGLLWLGQIATVATTGVLPPDLIKAGISSNPVYALDLGFFLPLCALAGIGLLRSQRRWSLGLPDVDLGRADGRRRRRRLPAHGCGRRSDRRARGRRHQRPECRVRDPGCGRPRPTRTRRPPLPDLQQPGNHGRMSNAGTPRWSGVRSCRAGMD
jgi:hypothetical protein